jgi:predicted Zn-dependent peptidase
VVKEEKRMRVDNQPYGNFLNAVMKKLFTKHPYTWVPIGSMEHLDAATLQEFIAFFKKYYVPNNAVLVIAGDIEIEKTKTLVENYFGEIPTGAPVVKLNIKEDPITSEIIDTAYDANIQIPAIMTAYRTPGLTSKEVAALELASRVLSGGQSSRMYKKMVDDKKNTLQVGCFNYALEDYGAYISYALPNGTTPLDTLLNDMDVEILKMQQELISETDFTKIRNQYENEYIGKNAKMLGIAENLADGYTFFNKNTNHINEELEEVRKVTREDIQMVSKKYLNKNQRVVVYYLPKK